MDFIPKLLAITSATLALIAFRGAEAQTPPPPTLSPVTTLRTLPIASQTTTTLPSDALCPQWWSLAQEAGWTPDLLPNLDYIIHRESRCQPEAHNTTLNRDGSADIGLTQINGRSWCKATRWYPSGYLQTVGVLAYVGCDELFNPYLNLKAAKAIYDYALRENENGWQPWDVKG